MSSSNQSCLPPFFLPFIHPLHSSNRGLYKNNKNNGTPTKEMSKITIAVLQEVDNRLSSILPSNLLPVVESIDVWGGDNLGLPHTGAAVILAIAIFILLALLGLLGE